MKFLIGLFLSILFFAPTHAMAMDAIGVVTKAINDVYILRADNIEGLQIKARLDDPVYLGDVFFTKNDKSYVQINFIDQTHITMNGEDSSLTIDEYIFNPEINEGNKARFSILKGSFEFVGGLLDKGESENVRLDLDLGSIGVRGTKILRSMKDDECWIYLEEGEIRVFNDGGSVVLKPGDGTRLSAKSIAPRAVEPWTQKEIDWIKRVTTPPEE